MHVRHSFCVAFVAITVFASGRHAAHAGDLNPPVGPVAPTMKSLDEVESRTPVQSLPGGGTFEHGITAPGSYYLTGDLVLTLPVNAVFVDADNVTLDLNGFSIVGTGGNIGVFVNDGRRNVVVRDGTIRNFAAGVWGISASDVRVDSLRVHTIAGQGIFLGDGGAVVSSIVSNCGDAGINVGAAGMALDSVARNNGGSGIGLGPGSVIENCIASANNFDGFISNGPVTATNLVANGNTQVGLNLGANSTVIGCAATANGGGGIRVTFNSVVRDSAASGNSVYGIQAVTDSLVVNNIVSNNAQGSGGIGIDIVGVRCHVQGNTSVNNAVGYKATMSSNAFLGNLARTNTDNYGQVAFGNAVGPIIGFADLPTNCNPDANRSF